MVRTRAGPTKVSAGKAPSKQRAVAAMDSPSRSSSSKHNQSFGNSYHPRETPNWQKPINSFFNTGHTSANTNANVAEEESLNISQNLTKEDQADQNRTPSDEYQGNSN